MRINSITIDSTNSKTELCELGVKYPTDKSPYSTENYVTPNGSGHRHPYTSVYNFLFSFLKYQKIKFAEIGILDNMSMLCWREYFPNAELFGFEYDLNYLQLGVDAGLHNTTYDFINVKLEESIENCLSTHGKFDVILDDSTHNFDDQIRICNVAHKYLNEGGILIIEDIFRSESEEKYKEGLKEISKYFSTMTFILTEHELLYSHGWNNDKLLILFRNNVK
jgi:SAM-dependent methyltransferase